MLKKNVYILYPAGYSGSYLNWAINISDNDLSNTTVKNPVNSSKSAQFGGVGTSHLHIRIPTHQGIDQHLSWVLYNKPAEPRVYIINANKNAVNYSICTIARYDPNGVFVNIHADQNDLIGSFGTINCVTKWPIYIKSLVELNPFLCVTPIHKNFDAHNCANDIMFRNWMVLNDSALFYHNRPLDHASIQQGLEGQRNWYRIRNQEQPHEVNESMYIADPDLSNRLFDISCLDICKPAFLEWFKEFMEQSQVSDGYNCKQVDTVHPMYMQSQPNMQWFNSIQQWELTGELDDYLLSHSGIQSQVIRLIFKHSGRVFLTDAQQDKWTSFFSRCRGPSWPQTSFDEYDFFKFPTWIQDEIKNFGYQLNITVPPIQEIADLDWENLSLQEINDEYQTAKHNPRS